MKGGRPVEKCPRKKEKNLALQWPKREYTKKILMGSGKKAPSDLPNPTTKKTQEIQCNKKNKV